MGGQLPRNQFRCDRGAFPPQHKWKRVESDPLVSTCILQGSHDTRAWCTEIGVLRHFVVYCSFVMLFCFFECNTEAPREDGTGRNYETCPEGGRSIRKKSQEVLGSQRLVQLLGSQLAQVCMGGLPPRNQLRCDGGAFPPQHKWKIVESDPLVSTCILQGSHDTRAWRTETGVLRRFVVYCSFVMLFCFFE